MVGVEKAEALISVSNHRRQDSRFLSQVSDKENMKRGDHSSGSNPLGTRTDSRPTKPLHPARSFGSKDPALGPRRSGPPSALFRDIVLATRHPWPTSLAFISGGALTSGNK
jgi:hypothetical protein